VVRLHRPAAADCREGRNGGEGDRHAEQQWQATFDEGLVGSGEDEGEHWQYARTQDRQNTAQIGNNEEQHWFDLALSMFRQWCRD
jgi:hypothetical protein